MKISIVVPCYNEEDVLKETHRRLMEIDCLGMDREIVYVDDGSTDSTYEILTGLAEGHDNVKVIKFQRNFGHQPAVSAGIAEADGDAVVVIDADLQDPPELISTFIGKWKEGYDIVYGHRVKRKGESIFKRFTAWAYYRMLSFIGGSFIPKDTGDFRLIDRKVADFLNSLTERNRFLRGLTAWAGFRSIGVDYVRDERFAGETKYTLRKMLRLAEDGVTSFSDKPMMLAFSFGAVLMLLSLVMLVLSIIIAAGGNGLGGVYIMGSVMLLILGAILIFVGILGLYISRIYDEVKNRPYYIIEKRINL